MKALIDYIFKEKKTVLWALLAGAVSGLTSVALFAQSGLLISKAALFPPFYIILILTAFIKLFGVSKSISKYAERLITHQVTFLVMSKIRILFFNRLLSHAHLLNRYNSGQLLTRMTTHIEIIQNFFLRVVYPTFMSAIVFLATIIFMSFFSLWIAACLLIGYILVSLIVPYFILLIGQASSQIAKERLTVEATEYLYGFRDLLLHQQLHNKKLTLSQLIKGYSKDKQRELDHEHIALLWNQLISLMTTVIIIIISAYLVSENYLDGVYLAMIVLVALTVFESVIPLAMAPNYYKHTKLAMSELNEISPIVEKINPKLLVEHIYSVQFINVSYYYPNVQIPAIHHINLSLQAGQRIAIIGPSGSGKSTLLHLIMKEFEPTHGDVLINSLDLNSFSTESFYEQISTMLQHNHFFSGTIQSNLQLAKPDATVEEMKQVLQKACLNKNLEAEVNEKGENLSGGEKQRLAFARLFLKQSCLWIMDEPFTHIDVEMESILFNTCMDEAKDKSVILVTHKLIGLEYFNCIYVMLNGSIVEYGTHAHLYSKQGVYSMMYSKQLEG